MLNRDTLLRHGRYRIVRLIGQGGMGAVYEAEDLSLKTKVAVKEALVYEASFRAAFEKEAQRLARLRHPALPKVIDHFVEQGEQYLVMEFIEGLDLGELLEQRKESFPVPQVIAWGERLLDALQYLHEEGVIHRDIKPTNIKLTPKGEVILLDFGLAKGGLTRHTLSGMSLKGYTPGFAPPEQVAGLATDERSDLYSLAATLYALLTNQAPQNPSVRQEVMAHNVPDPLKPANQLNPHVSPQLAQILARALALEPQQRFSSAAQMRSELSRPPSIRPPSIPPNNRGEAPIRAPSISPNYRGDTIPRWLLAALGVFALTVISLLIIIAVNLPRGNDSASDDAIAQVTIEASTPSIPPNSGDSGEQVEATKASLGLLPTETPTATPIPPTETPTDTPIPPTETSTNTAIPPTETPTNTPIPPPTSPPSTDPIISEIDGMKLLYVPEGEFLMGSADNDPDAYDDEKPQHAVFLSAYRIDETEVTNAMFATFVEQTGHQTEAEREGTGWTCVFDANGDYDCDYIEGADWRHPQGPESDLTGLDTHPVVQVSWNDATAYCEWAGRRLPTEAEWEKAAGGTDGRKWPWGNNAPNGNLLNFCDQNCRFDHKDANTYDGYEFTSPVGNYPAGASPYGALDMAGNVWEWVQDSYNEDFYASSPKENPLDESSIGTKVLRGGSWWFTARYTRVRNRGGNDADNRDVNGGFRCARSYS